MKKKIISVLTAAMLIAAIDFPAYASAWQQDGTGWWYQKEDGSYLNNGWNWIGGKCYYFTPEGYCLINTTTPDGCHVDQTGAWVVDGVVQTQEQNQGQVSVSNLTIVLPAGYFAEHSDQGNDGVYLTNRGGDGMIGVLSRDVPEAEAYSAQVNERSQEIADGAMSAAGVPVSKEVKTFPTGSWYAYVYSDGGALGLNGPLHAYIRVNGAKCQMILFAGNTGVNPDEIMMNNVK